MLLISKDAFKLIRSDSKFIYNVTKILILKNKTKSC